MKSYSVYVASHIAESLPGMKRKDREQLLRFFNKLRRNPFLEGDYSEHDEIGRQVKIVLTGRSAVAFWVDHAVCEVKILDLRSAGN